MSHILLLPLFLFAMSDVAIADIIRDGSYNGGISRIVIEDGYAGFAISSETCGGEVDARLSQNSAGDWFAISHSAPEPQCVVSLRHQGRFTIIADEIAGCQHYRGFQCSFSGYYRRTE